MSPDAWGLLTLMFYAAVGLAVRDAGRHLTDPDESGGHHGVGGKGAAGGVDVRLEVPAARVVEAVAVD